MIKKSSFAGPCKNLHNYYKKNYAKIIFSKGKRVKSYINCNLFVVYYSKLIRQKPIYCIETGII